MTVSENQMFSTPDQTLMLETVSSWNVKEITDGYSACLINRCHRKRDAIRLTLTVAMELKAGTEKSASAFNEHLGQELNLVNKIVAKIELQLQQTEKQLTVCIDQSFRDLQITLAQTQLEESGKSIKQADTVARLTILAFVFIPISAICGFFGMNIVEIADDGGFSFCIFGVTTGVVLAMALPVAFADSIYTLRFHYASKLDGLLSWRTLYPHELWTQKVQYILPLGVFEGQGQDSVWSRAKAMGGFLYKIQIQASGIGLNSQYQEDYNVLSDSGETTTDAVTVLNS